MAVSFLKLRKGRQCLHKQIRNFVLQILFGWRWFKLFDPTTAFPQLSHFKEFNWAGRLAGIDNWLSEAAVTISKSLVIEEVQPSARHLAEMAFLQ